MSAHRLHGQLAQQHSSVVDEVCGLFVAGEHSAVGVMSPPGAGKSTLVRTAAARWVDRNRTQAPLVTQTNNQADDLARDLLTQMVGTGHTIGRLHGRDYTPPAALRGRGDIRFSTNIRDLDRCSIVVAPARKWAYVDGSWEAGIIDEAFQMRSDDLLRIANRFSRLLVVGDPGQLNPFTTADDRALRGRPLNPLETAAETLRLTQPHAPWRTLPVSWRLPASAAAIISEAFYTVPFVSGTDDGERRLNLPPLNPNHSARRAIAAAAGTGWAFLELPAAHLPRTDPEVVEVIATLTDSIIKSTITATDETGTTRALTTADIAIGVTHRDQRGHVATAVNRVLIEHGQEPGAIAVDTANRLQGRQFEIVIAWHPLSGRRDATTFHLEAGRLCVLLSRHRHACIVVGRGGIREQLESHPGVEPVWMGEAPPAVDGWEANLALLDRLEQHRIAA